MRPRIDSEISPSGFWYAQVVSVDTTKHISVRIPKLGGQSVYEQVRYAGFYPEVGDFVWVSFIENSPSSLLAFPSTASTSHEIPEATHDPIGHEDRTKSRIAFDNTERRFSIAPDNGSYVIWCAGQRFEKTGTDTVTIPDVTDLYYIYFDTDGVLQYRESYFNWGVDCITSYVFWNADTGRAEFFADERHGITMDWQTHEYLHRTRGAAIASGFDASNFDVATQDGSTDAQAQLDIGDGTFFDEDLQVDISHSESPVENTFQQHLQGPARIPVMYRVASGWVYDDPTDFPVKQGTSHPVYNSTVSGVWGTTEIDANKYGVQWVVATNQLNYPVLSIMGQDIYDNIGQAESISWGDMDLEGLPVVELRVLYKIIFRTTGSNTPGCYFAQIDDYRRALLSSTSSAPSLADHGSLSGLSDDDHLQYALSDGSRGSFEVAGAVSTHELATDPHPQYLTVTEGNSAYEPLGSVASHSSDTTGIHGIVDTSALLDTNDIGVTVQAHSTVLDGTTASFTVADESKLDGIEVGATADMTANEILTAVKTVDGVSSGLDADLLDGQEGSYYQDADNLNAGTVPSARVSGSYTGITGTGALSAGSISSGFGSIDNGSSSITTTGTITGGAFSLDGTRPLANLTYISPTTSPSPGSGAGSARLFDQTYSSGSATYRTIDLDSYDDASLQIEGVSIAGAKGVWLSVTAVPSTATGYLAFLPYSASWGSTLDVYVSHLSYTASGGNVNTMVYVPLDTSKRFTMYNHTTPIRVIVDLVRLEFE